MNPRKALAALVLPVMLLVVLLVVACGKRGDPHPPIPVIPQATTDLLVTQRADQVILSWSYPSLTTAGKSLTAIRRITVFRYEEELPASAVGRDPNQILPGDIDTTIPQDIALFSKVPTIPQAQFIKLSHRIESIEKANLASVTAGSRLIFTDKPPLRSGNGRPVRITYAVVTEGETARGDYSNQAIIVPLPVATAPIGLTATPKPEGIVLTWQEPKTSVRSQEVPVVSGYRVYRTAPGESLIELAMPLNTTPVAGTTFTDNPPYGDHEYRVAAVAFDGPPLLQSDPSAPVKTTFRDLVPPPVPASITALIETKVVRLIWEPVDAPDLAGYRLYRSEGMGHGNAIKDIGTVPLTNDTVTNTTFADPNANLGIAYRYAVAAIDKSGNESAKVWTEWVVAPKSP